MRRASRLAAILVGLALATPLSLAHGAAAKPGLSTKDNSGAWGSTTVTANGRTLTVAPSHNLDPAGQKITVTGSKYDDGTEGRRAQGIYVALCVDNGPGKTPTPCIGGADMTGGAGASLWISNNPPAGMESLVKPFGPGGSFSYELTLKRKDENADCAVFKCMVVTRSDHTASGDRSQDVPVPVSWVGDGDEPPAGSGMVVKHARVKSIPSPRIGSLNIDPVRNTVYVSSPGLGSLSTISGASHEPAGTPIKLGRLPSQLAVNAKTGAVYVVNRGVGGKPELSIVDGHTRTVTATVPVGAEPNGVAVNTVTDRAYVTVGSTGSVAVIGGNPPAVITTPTVGAGPNAIAVNEKTQTVYVANYSAASVSVLDGKTNQVVKTIPVGAQPSGLAVDAANAKVYVANQLDGTVSVIDSTTNTVVGKPIPVGADPANLALDPLSGLIYVPQGEIGQVSVVDPAQQKVIDKFDVAKPGTVAVNPDTGFLYVTNRQDNAVEVFSRQFSPKITVQPGDQGLDVGGKVTFTATAVGVPQPKSIWQTSIDGGKSWTDLRSVPQAETRVSVADTSVTATLSFPVTAKENGRKYRAVFSNEIGETNSVAALLTVRTPPPPASSTTPPPPSSTTTTPPPPAPTTTSTTAPPPPAAVDDLPAANGGSARLANTGAGDLDVLLLVGLATVLAGALLVIGFRRRGAHS